MNGIPSASAVSCRSSKTRGLRFEPRSMTGPRAERMAAELVDVDARRVGRVRDVDHDREVGLQRERGGRRAAERRLLLHGGDRHDVARRAARLRDEPRRLVGDVAAEAVVHRARHGAPVGELDRLGGDDRDVADAHPRAGLVAVRRADVDVQVLELGDLLALVVLEQVDRLACPMTPGTTPSRVASSTRWPTRICGSHPPTPAKRRKPSSSMCVTISPISSMWPTMASVGAARGARDPCRRGAHDVGRHLGERAGRLAPHRGGRGLVAGRSGRGEQGAQHWGDGHSGGA